MVAETVYAEGLLPRALAHYHRARPDVSMELDIGPTARLVEWVSLAWYDLGLVVLPIPKADISLRPLRRQRALCVLPADHPLACRDQVALRDLDQLPFVSLVSGTPFRTAIDRAFEECGVHRDILLEVRTQMAVCTLVAEGAGASLVDPALAADIWDERIVFRPIVPEVSWEIGLILPKVRPTSLLVDDFCNALQATIEATFVPGRLSQNRKP
jgi:DNA-binding transcriptional LysR family regulator